MSETAGATLVVLAVTRVVMACLGLWVTENPENRFVRVLDAAWWRIRDGAFWALRKVVGR